jgi:hypothetical protein
VDIVEVLTIGNRELEGNNVRQTATSKVTSLGGGNLGGGVAHSATDALTETCGNAFQILVSSVSLAALHFCLFHECLFVLRFVDVLTMRLPFPSGNTYFSHTTATALIATASIAKKIFADGWRSPFRMRETVDLCSPALLASSLLPSFAFFIAFRIVAIRLSSSAMAGRCHGETALTSGNGAGTLRGVLLLPARRGY